MIRSSLSPCVLAALLFGPAAAVGCSETPDESANRGEADVTSAETRFDTIDAAMLFPLDAARMVQLGENAVTGGKVTLLSRAQFAQALQLTDHGEQVAAAAPPYESWRIVAFRFDPCATSTPSTTDCKTTLRLVAQPVSKTGADDHAFHLIYTLPAGEDVAIATELAAAKASCQKTLKKGTNGAPLGIHPCLALPEAKRKDFRAQIHAVILKHAGEDKLAAVSSMFTLGAQDNWFFGASIVRAGKLVQVPVPALVDPKSGDPAHPEAIHQTFSDSSPVFNPTAPRNGSMLPLPTNPASDQLGVTINERKVRSMLSATPPSLDAIKAGLRASVRIENPKLHDVLSPNDSVSCVDCHMTGRARSNVAKNLPAGMTMDGFDLTTDAFVAPPQTTVARPTVCGPTPKPGEACLLPEDINYVVKAFAYHGGQITVIPRVANEAALVADFINRTLLPK